MQRDERSGRVVEPREYYFDHNASTPVEPEVLECFQRVEADTPANPNSLHSSGRRSRAVLEDARHRIAELFGVEDRAVLFVSGGTEANNLAIQTCGDPSLPVQIAPVEHPSAWDAAAHRGRVAMAVDGAGRARVEDPKRAIGLICLVHGQNEVGTLQPIPAAAELARELAVPLHVDASQTLGRVPLAEAAALADSLTFSSHKVGGLRGMSVLVQKPRAGLGPLFLGGQQEFGLRPGTPSPALAAATALALERALAEQPVRSRQMAAAREAFLTRLDPERARSLTPEASLPNTAMLRFDVHDGRALLPALDLSGVMASQGSACSSGSPEPPPVLRAMGFSEADARRCVRFSFGYRTTVETAERGGEVVAGVIAKMRRARGEATNSTSPVSQREEHAS